MIDNRYKATRRQLKNMFDKYGVGFTCACCYLMENGFVKVNNMTDEEFEKIKQQLYEQEKESREKGHPIVGTEFQIQIVEVAKEITRISTEMELLMFQKEMPWEVGIKEPKYYKRIIQDLIYHIYSMDNEDEESWPMFQIRMMELLDLEEEDYNDLWTENR